MIFAAAVLERVGAEHRAGRQERQSHRGGLEANGQGVIAPFGDWTLRRIP